MKRKKAHGNKSTKKAALQKNKKQEERGEKGKRLQSICCS